LFVFGGMTGELVEDGGTERGEETLTGCPCCVAEVSVFGADEMETEGDLLFATL